MTNPYAPPPYISGSLITTTATFTNASGTQADPSVVTLMYRKGYGTITTVTYPAPPVTRSAPGVYQANLDTTGWAGPDDQLWTVQWSGTGGVQAIAVSYWTVIPAVL